VLICPGKYRAQQGLAEERPPLITPQLVINKQVGQWGTSYNQAQDLVRVPVQMSPTPEHVEDLTITIRNLDAGRGAFDFAWGLQVATATFTVM